MPKIADIKLFNATETNQPSTFIRLVDGLKEYKLEVFDDQVCLHLYNDGKKVGASYYIDIEKLPTNGQRGKHQEDIYDDLAPDSICGTEDGI